MFDLRVPSGLFFLILGTILVAVGLISDPRAALTDTNVNLYTGIFMLGFGGIMLWLSRRKTS
ncbi:MAG: hypothetical protein ABI693_05300 [Bryobacteraceae bacterium]